MDIGREGLLRARDPNLRLWYFFLLHVWTRPSPQLPFDPRGRLPGLHTTLMSPCNLFNFTPQSHGTGPDADNGLRSSLDIMDDERPSRKLKSENRVAPFPCLCDLTLTLHSSTTSSQGLDHAPGQRTSCRLRPCLAQSRSHAYPPDPFPPRQNPGSSWQSPFHQILLRPPSHPPPAKSFTISSVYPLVANPHNPDPAPPALDPPSTCPLYRQTTT